MPSSGTVTVGANVSPVERHDDSVRAVRPAARAGVFEQILVPVLERVDVSVKQVGVAVGVVDALDDCDVAVGGLQGREPRPPGS